jgi:DnaJ-class molecular chaperone
VKPESSNEEIKHAYRSLAKKFHPDVNTQSNMDYNPDAQKFRLVAEAYGVLSCPESRLDYDLMRRKVPEAIKHSNL